VVAAVPFPVPFLREERPGKRSRPLSRVSLGKEPAGGRPARCRGDAPGSCVKRRGGRGGVSAPGHPTILGGWN